MLEEQRSEETTTRGAQVLSRRLIKESEGETSPAINNGNVAFPIFFLFDSSLLGLSCTERGRT